MKNKEQFDPLFSNVVSPPAQVQQLAWEQEQKIKQLEKEGRLPPVIKAVCEVSHMLKKYIVY